MRVPTTTALLGCLLLGFAFGSVPHLARADDSADEDLAAALRRASEIEADLITTCRKVRQATVSVVNLQHPRRGREVLQDQPVQPRGYGSGVLVERKGKLWVVTNVHVIQGADAVEIVTSDGTHRPMTVRDTIAQYDIALLAFEKRPRGLKSVQIDPKASRRLEVGAWVVATGNPFSLALDGPCVTCLGVVSGKDRILPGQFFYGNAIQHDARVNPGNSGGPLWSLKGELVGINGKISSWSQFRGARPSNTGASYSLPIHQVSEFLLSMIDKRTDARAGYLGLEVETAKGAGGKAVGALVTKAHDRSPAASGRSKLVEGDVVTSIFFVQSWRKIHTASDLTNLLALASVGDFLKIKYKRGRSNYAWSGRLGDRPKKPRKR